MAYVALNTSGFPLNCSAAWLTIAVCMPTAATTIYYTQLCLTGCYCITASASEPCFICQGENGTDEFNQHGVREA
jgi:hypothetical protein